MPFSFRIQLFAVIQVILTALFTYIFVTNEYRDLSEQNVATLEAFLIEQKQQELKNYTEIAKASIQHIYAGAAKDDPVAQELVANILSTLIYDGHDGYFLSLIHI